MAAKFRKIDPRIWTDEGFVRLTPESRLLAFWLLTGSRVNRCGIVQWSAALASEETGIDRHGVDTVLDTVCHTLSWVCDPPVKLVFLARWWRYNPPPNGDALKGAMDDLRDLPRNSLCNALRKACADIPHPLHTVYHTVLDTVYHTVSPQEKEKEKEKEKDILPVPGEVVEPNQESKPPRKKPAKLRPRNELFDAVAEVTGSDPVVAASHVGKVAASLAKAEPPYTPDDVRRFAKRFLDLCPWAAGSRTRPELGELQKHIGKIRAAKPATVSTFTPAVIDNTFHGPSPNMKPRPPKDTEPEPT